MEVAYLLYTSNMIRRLISSALQLIRYITDVEYYIQNG